MDYKNLTLAELDTKIEAAKKRIWEFDYKGNENNPQALAAIDQVENELVELSKARKEKVKGRYTGAIDALKERGYLSD